MLMVGCADKDLVTDSSNPDLLDGKAEGYFKINLNLPTAPVVSTRAWAEDAAGTLNDGLEDEYGVHTCLLLLFSGDSEGEATLKQVEDISHAFDGVTDTPNQITSNYEKVVKLDQALTGNIYALAVVNGKGNIEQNSATSIKVRKATASNDMIVLPGDNAPCTIASLQAALSTSASVGANDFIYHDDTSNKNYFFMTNAVLSNEKGGISEPATAAGNQHILASVDKSYIYETEAKAEAGNAAADIYVERGMAKVTIKTASLGTNALDGKALGSGKLKATATLTGWCLDITNKTSYVVRKVPTGDIWNLKSFSNNAATDKYRFVGGNPVDGVYGTNIAGYRTYWALDPNYGTENTVDGVTNKNTDLFSYANFAEDLSAEIGDENPKYCLENTFDVAHQDARYTTRAVIAVDLTAEGANEDPVDFYLMGADRKTLYTLADVEAQVLTKLKNSTMFTNWYNTNGGGHTLTLGDVTIAWDKNTAGVIKVQRITIKKEALKAGTTDDVVITKDSPSALADVVVEEVVTSNGVISAINEQLVNVERFVGGVSYYAIRIKHFGDDLTPWNNGEYYGDNAPAEASAKTTGESEAAYSARQIASIYPDAGETSSEHRQDANYLGRYGMVRNNWYELVIGDILKVGSAEPPVIPSHPDDDLESSYIKARINILSWAKRPQNWDLK